MTTTPASILFRKKPVVIEAVQIAKRMDLTSPPWWAEAVQQNRVILRGMGKFTRDLPMVEIQTLEGVMTGVQGDWIIRGVQGELYPCKPDIFAATYEPACTPPATAQDAITVSLDPDPRGVSVGVWQGSSCIYNGAHAVPAPAAGDAQTPAARDVLAERQRQISAEGWTAERDDKYAACELADAAAQYVLHASGWKHLDVWPWERSWLKLSTPRRNLVKAGALILAEIERLDRAAIAAQVPQQGEA